MSWMTGIVHKVELTLDPMIVMMCVSEKLSYYAIACGETWDAHVRDKSKWPASIKGEMSKAIGAGIFESAEVENRLIGPSILM